MFARTERLLLRPGWAEDAADLAQAIAYEAVALRLARVPWPYSEADARWFLEQHTDARKAVFLIFRRTAARPELIGGIGIHPTDEGTPELGYWITPDHWGKGYATEAGHAVLTIARDTLNMPRLAAGHFADNPASAQVLRKLGFVQTGKEVERMNMARGVVLPCALYEANLGGGITAGSQQCTSTIAA